MSAVVHNPVVIIPGVLFWDSLYEVMKDALSSYMPRAKIAIAPVSFIDWVGFPPSPERSTNRVMAAIDKSVREMGRKYPGEPVTLIAHSGGGTVAMIYLLENSFQGDVYHPGESVGKLITLGTPFHTHEHYAKIKTDFIFKHITNDFSREFRSSLLPAPSIRETPMAVSLKKCVIYSIKTSTQTAMLPEMVLFLQKAVF